MSNKQKANFIAWTHFFWIAFGILSVPLLFVFPWWNIVVLIYVAVQILTQLFFGGCWLVQLENKYRTFDSQSWVTHNMFTHFYLKKFFNIDCSKSVIKFLGYALFISLITISLSQIL